MGKEGEGREAVADLGYPSWPVNLELWLHTGAPKTGKVFKAFHSTCLPFIPAKDKLVRVGGYTSDHDPTFLKPLLVRVNEDPIWDLTRQVYRTPVQFDLTHSPSDPTDGLEILREEGWIVEDVTAKLDA